MPPGPEPILEIRRPNRCRLRLLHNSDAFAVQGNPGKLATSPFDSSWRRPRRRLVGKRGGPCARRSLGCCIIVPPVGKAGFYKGILTMTSVGSILKAERERQGRDVAGIAEELCIMQRYVRAIEKDVIVICQHRSYGLLIAIWMIVNQTSTDSNQHNDYMRVYSFSRRQLVKLPAVVCYNRFVVVSIEH